MLRQTNDTASSQNIGFATQPKSAGSPVLPEHIDKKEWMDNYAYSSYLSETGHWETRGCPQSGMSEYETKCREITNVFSYQEGENDEESWIMFGELKDDSVFHFKGGCDYTGFDCRGGGVMIVAPGWENLFDNLRASDLRGFVKNMSQKNSPELTKDLNTRLGNVEELRSTLKEIFSTR